MNRGKINIGSPEVIFAMLNVFIIKVVVGYSQNMVGISATASWLMMIYLTVISLIIFWIMARMMKNFEQKDIVDICSFSFGKALGMIYGTLMALFIILRVASILRQTGDRFKIVAYPESPMGYIILFFVIAAIIASYAGFDSVIRGAKIMVPFVLFSILVLLIGNFDISLSENLLPILGNGYKSIFLESLPLLSLYTAVLFLLFMPPYMKDNKVFSKTGIKVIIFGGLLYAVMTAILLMVFPYPTAQNLLMPVYVLSELIGIGDKIQRLEALFLIAWVLSIMLYMGMLISLSVEILRKTFALPDRRPLIIPISGIVFFIALIPERLLDIKNIEQNIFEKYSLIVIFILPVIILTAANIKQKIQNKQKKVTS